VKAGTPKTKSLTGYLAGLVFSTVLLLQGCAGPGYYLQAASGQWKLMHSRQDINEMLENPDTEPGLAQRLEASRGILEFAENRLGLPAGASYSSYVETGRTAVAWNVIAVPEFSLAAKKWCFMVAGCVPYRGFFEHDKAGRFAAKFRNRGLDVAVTPVTAFSTLGWFRDPLLDTMLRGSDTQLAATMFHELAHQRLYIRGDTAFNEAFASFVAYQGVLYWLESTGGKDAQQQWLSARNARDQFYRMLAQSRRQLSGIYASALGETEMRRAKQQVFAALKSDTLQRQEEQWGGRDYFGFLFAEEFNNARLILFNSYEGGVCAFSALFRQAGEDFIEFHRLAGLRAAMDRGKRQAWLAQSCAGIASAHEL